MTKQLPEIVLGSRNQKKCNEIAGLLAPHNIKLISVADFPDVSDVVEDGNTFGENAGKKARETALATEHWVIAEDSGLCVDALKGAPGIYSARYAGEPCDDQKNNAKLIEALNGIPPEKRGAHYVCHVSLSDPAGEIRLEVEATCQGRVVDDPRGSNGFGYDPHFLVREYHKTFGELSAVVKQILSHRGRAFYRFIPQLVQFFQQEAME